MYSGIPLFFQFKKNKQQRVMFAQTFTFAGCFICNRLLSAKINHNNNVFDYDKFNESSQIEDVVLLILISEYFQCCQRC